MKFKSFSLSVTLVTSLLFNEPLMVLAASAHSTLANSGSTAPSPRQQVNTISAYLDGSVVYGSDPTRANALRAFAGGQLKTSAGNLLPLNTAGLPNANDAHIVPDDQLFLAGDVRANENIELLAVQTLFVREHNTLASALAAANPKLTDEQLYQQARQMVIAELQAITYNEFLPALLGPGALKPYTGYKSSANAGIANEFSTAAYRIGHTLINHDIDFLDNSGQEIRPPVELTDAFFNPTAIKAAGADPILKYLATDNAQEVDLNLIDALRNFLFGPPGAGGLDLASLNIQRGRDHGLADYNAARKAYGLPDVTSFAQITSSTTLQNKLQALYGNTNNIDLWVGGLAEDHMPGTSVGPTFRAIIADQFTRVRDGDRFWYERVFAGDALKKLQATHLSDVLERNTTLTNLQDNVFYYDVNAAPPPANSTRTELVTDKNATASQWKQGVQFLVTTARARTYDGTNNNLEHPTWGSAGVALLRMAPAAYADGISTPAGQNRPSARVISNALSAQTTNMPNSRNMSDWIYAWGQFIDHDLDLTNQGTESFNIPVPQGDPYFDPASTGTQVIPFMRSNYDVTNTLWSDSNANKKRRTFPSLSF